MIHIICKDCGRELNIFDARNLGDLVTIKVEPCECNEIKKCNNHCEEITELKNNENQYTQTIDELNAKIDIIKETLGDKSEPKDNSSKTTQN